MPFISLIVTLIVSNNAPEELTGSLPDVRLFSGDRGSGCSPRRHGVTATSEFLKRSLGCMGLKK